MDAILHDADDRVGYPRTVHDRPPCDCANPYLRERWSAPAASSAQRADEACRRAALLTPRPVWHRLARRSYLRRAAATVLAVFLAVAAFQLVGTYRGASSNAGEGLPLAPSTTSDARDGSASTPRDQWRAGEVPFLYQTDAAWSEAPYAESTVAESGCGPSSLAMVYIALTGRTDLDPAAMAVFSERGGYVEDGLTSWRLMTDGAAELGLSSREVPSDKGALKAELAAAHPVICSVGPGDFTAKGHFIVLAGLADDGRLVVHDPNSPARSAQTWEVERVLAQCRNLWAFEKG